MGSRLFSTASYKSARREYAVESDVGVTRHAEVKARQTGKLSDIVDPAVNPIRQSKIRLNPHDGKWIATVGMPMDIEVTCDTTGSMGGEVDTEMKVLPDLYEAVAKVLPGYDPQLCLGIFGDVQDQFVMCRPQFEMEAPKIVNYLKEMAPQRDGGDAPEDPQYAMFARAYLTDAYTNKIGLKGYHFVVTDATCHQSISTSQIKRIFGENIFENELKDMDGIPSMTEMIDTLKEKTHQFILIVGDYRNSTVEFWNNLCGEKSVIVIRSTNDLPVAVSAIVGLTEGTLDVTDLPEYVGQSNYELVGALSRIDIGAQAKLRHNLEHPVPKTGDIYRNKGDIWPIQPGEETESVSVEGTDEINYL